MVIQNKIFSFLCFVLIFLFSASHGFAGRLSLKEPIPLDPEVDKGIKFSVDKKRRVYIVHDDYVGDFTNEMAFPPLMDITIEARYELVKEGAAEKVYKYVLINGSSSEASMYSFELQSLFPPRSWPVRGYERRFEDGVVSNLYYPNTTLYTTNFFKLYQFKYGDYADVAPGERSKEHFEIKDIEGSLPGVLSVYIRVSGFVTPSVEDPFYTASRNKLFHYSGKTVGPVPEPETLEHEKFLGKIIEYNKESIKQGWNYDKTVIEFTENGFSKISNSTFNAEVIDIFLKELDVFYSKGKILSEGYVLLRYNLEFLRDCWNAVKPETKDLYPDKPKYPDMYPGKSKLDDITI